MQQLGLIMSYKFRIIGNVDDGFTSVEISDGAGELVARVFELESGSWYLETHELDSLTKEDLVKAIIDARNELRHYINRKGGQLPEGTTRAAFSLWLMQRDDGRGLFSI